MDIILYWIFGLSSFCSLLFALFVYFKSREWIYPLIIKLKASWNNLQIIESKAARIVNVAGIKEMPENEKIEIMRQIARTIQDTLQKNMNTIDDGKNWQEKSIKEIYNTIKR